MSRLVDIRPDERRGTLSAFFTLLGVTAGHTLLETARDALFLAKLPVSRLPWVYLAIAAIGLALARAGGRSGKRSAGRRGVATSLLAAAAITAGFWVVAGLWQGTALFYALYVWTGIFASWVVVAFWLMLGASFTVGQAKRLYGFIGAGSVLGAVLGAGVARVLAEAIDARHFLVAASGLFVLTALGPGLYLGSLGRAEAEPRRRGEARAAPERPGIGEELAVVGGDPYVKRILALVLLATIALTTVDYLFKSAVAARIPPAELGAFFASVYVVLNASALVVQVLAVGWVLRTFGVHRALWIMPILIVTGACGVLAGGGLTAALLLRGADGTFRHSLHRTSTELLYVPIPDAIRARAKPLIDLIGQRGGQAIASLAILGLVAAGVGERGLALAVAVLALAWIAVAWGIQRPYLDVFRATLREGKVDYDGALPALDLGALEALFSALNSKKDAEVLGALDLLAAQARQRLIPALILYHPSKRIVLRALELFTSQGRDDFVPIADRLLDHADPEVRAAALRARAAIEPDHAFLRSLLSDPHLEVRATALVSLVGRGAIEGAEADEALGELARGSLPVRVALARAISEGSPERAGSAPGHPPDPSLRSGAPAAFAAVLEELSRHEEPELVVEVARAAGKTGERRLLPWLISLLGQREQGAAARDALVAMGDEALAALDRAVADPALPAEARWGVPRAVSMFPAERAAPILLRHLESAPDGMTRFRALRALGKVRADDPDVALDAAVLARAADAALAAAIGSLSFRLDLERGRAEDPRRDTPASELMAALLRDKEAHAMERLFRVLGLCHPTESFERIRRGLQSKSAKTRASSRELIEHALAPPLRATVLALVEELPDAERLTRAGSAHARPRLGYEDLVRDMVARGNELGSLAAYHAAELGIELGERARPASAAGRAVFVTGVAARARELAGVAHA